MPLAALCAHVLRCMCLCAGFVCVCIMDVLIMTFFVVYEVLVDKKDKCSVLIHSSTLGLKKCIAKNLLN